MPLPHNLFDYCSIRKSNFIEKYLVVKRKISFVYKADILLTKLIIRGVAMKQDKQKEMLMQAHEYFEKKDYVQAEQYFRKAIKKNGSFNAMSFYYIGLIEKLRGEFARALENVKKAAECLEQETNMVGKSYQGKIYTDLAYLYFCFGLEKEAEANYYKAYTVCDEIRPKYSNYTNYLHVLVTKNISGIDLVNAAKGYNSINPPAVSPQHNKEKIRIAYISPDFRNHILFYFISSLLSKYDRNKFYVVCVGLNKEKDIVTEAIRNTVDEYIDVSGLEYEKIACLLKGMNIDILFDLAGHTASSGLPVLGYRVAPVQISGIGWIGPMSRFSTT